ncbi:programmed cell death 1 ligand 1-like isoform X1 [Seriola dumerili]|uniref:Programmed cell death 1 ligand 1-like n=2 Tax=Seriola dumerili TaxID=41447 RepID=A0A3B4TE60_SERDU|nr:programmed cell death 1 ligand 1-like isoform X1 [Seriola dumerili]
MSRCRRFMWFIVLLCVNTVSCQVVVKGFIGDSVLLPCIYTEKYLQPEKVNVYWRDRDDNILLDIISGVHNMKTQNEKFRGRVISPPDLNRKGNFSIALQNVQEEDTGLYECHIPEAGVEQRVQLTVTGKRVGVSGTDPGPAPSEPPAGNAAVTLTPPLLTQLSVLSLCSLGWTQVHT